MLSPDQVNAARKRAIAYYAKAGLQITEQEKSQIEIADFGLGDLQAVGLQVLVYVNTLRVCAKELVMFPYQICPEHKHPSLPERQGKEETFRVRWGTVHLYVQGPANSQVPEKGIENYKPYLQVAHEIILHPGGQYTIMPDTLHWFRAGEEGAVVSEFSTMSTDEDDVFTDPRINRFTIIQ